MGPAASKNASKTESRDLAVREAGRFGATSELVCFRERSDMERLEFPQINVMIVLLLEVLSQRDILIFTDVWNVL